MKKLISHFGAILGLSFVVVCPSIAQEPQYTIEGISTLPYRDASNPSAYSINNRGQIVGAVTRRINRAHVMHAFLWDKNSGMLDLGVFPYASWSLATSINDLGEVVGVAEKQRLDSPPRSIFRGFTWLPLTGIQEVGTLIRNFQGFVGDSENLCINNNGLFAGNSSYYNSSNSVIWGKGYVGESIADPGYPGLYEIPPFINGGVNYAYWINDLNYAVGKSWTYLRPYLFKWNNYQWNNYQVIDLGLLPGHEVGEARAINNKNQVVGNNYGTINGRYEAKGFVWSNGVLSELRDDDLVLSRAFAINNHSEILGQSDEIGLCLWTEQNGIQKISDLLPPNSGWTIQNATAINDRGQIIGSGIINNELTSFIMTPIAPSLAGWITLQSCQQAGQTITAHFVPTDGGETLTKESSVNGAGFFCFRNVPTGQYNVLVKGKKWLAKKLRVTIRQSEMNDVSLTLLGGDTNDDNSVDIFDLLEIVRHYNSSENYSNDVDVNCDGRNDILDLLLIVSNYNRHGDIL